MVTLNGAVLTLRQPVRENATCSDKFVCGFTSLGFYESFCLGFHEVPVVSGIPVFCITTPLPICWADLLEVGWLYPRFPGVV